METTKVLFSAAAAVSLVAFVSLILFPAVGSFGRWYEKVGAGVLSFFILGVLVIIGVLAGFVGALVRPRRRTVTSAVSG